MGIAENNIITFSVPGGLIGGNYYKIQVAYNGGKPYAFSSSGVARYLGSGQIKANLSISNYVATGTYTDSTGFNELEYSYEFKVLKNGQVIESTGSQTHTNGLDTFSLKYVDGDYQIKYIATSINGYTVEASANFSPSISLGGNSDKIKLNQDTGSILSDSLSWRYGNDLTLVNLNNITEDNTVKHGVTYYYDSKNLYFTTSTKDQAVQGDIILYQYEGEEYLTPLAYDIDSDEFTSEAAKGLSSYNNVFKYDDITPKISEVGAEIFDYDKNRKNYRVCDELVSTIGAFAFVPLLNPIAKALNGSCYSFVVKLTADNNIDYISFKVLTNSFYNDISECKLTFENVGTTELPGYIFIEEKQEGNL